jgi:hypothetical protein
VVFADGDQAGGGDGGDDELPAGAGGAGFGEDERIAGGGEALVEGIGRGGGVGLVEGEGEEDEDAGGCADAAGAWGVWRRERRGFVAGAL